jgi:outer membrane immunogenic protein
MKKQFLGAVAVIVFLATPASAADLVLKAPVTMHNWTGCYLGANGGWKSGRFVDTVTVAGGSVLVPGVGLVPFAPGTSLSDPVTTNSGAAGGQVGCRWENGEHWVFGLEGDFDWTSLNAVATNTTSTTGLFPGDRFTNHASWESSGRVVFGRALDRWLVYGTGGFAFSRVTMSGAFAGGPFPTVPAVAVPSSTSDSQILTGGTLGFGATYALGSNWEIGAEYRYTSLMPKNFNLGNVTAVCLGTPPVCVSTAATGHKGLDTNEVLVRLNYSFGRLDGAR